MPAIRSIDPGARETLLRELREFARRLAAELRAEQVILFGSLARGDQHEGSDIDLLVVMPYEGRVFEAIGEVLSRTELPVEPVVARPESLTLHLREGHPLFTRIMAEGIRLHPA